VRLLLCDRQRLLLDALVPALHQAGHVVTGICDRPDALSTLVARGRPDVCVLEASYGGTTRLDAIATLRCERPETALVLLTAQACSEVWQAYDDGMVDAVVNKASSFDVVDAMIHAARQGRRQVSGFHRPLPTARPLRPGLDALTGREREVLDLLAGGASTLAIATQLAVSKNTVRTHVASVLRKLSVHDRGKAVSIAVHLGIV
jgi:DNA-binding NarL/FixJ family response regulator